MDQVTQQNAALVEEMAAAASSLEHQARDLVSTVSVFQLEGADRVLQGNPVRAHQVPVRGAVRRAPAARLALAPAGTR